MFATTKRQNDKAGTVHLRGVHGARTEHCVIRVATNPHKETRWWFRFDRDSHHSLFEKRKKK
jgi:hypothetical protein